MKTEIINPPLSFAAYQRIFNITMTHLNAVDASPEFSCIIFSLVGVRIIRHYYNIPVKMVAGAAFYALDDSVVPPAGVGYASSIVNGIPNSDGDHFHCWIQCNGYAIDLMAPLFPKLLQANKQYQEKLRRSLKVSHFC